MLHSMRRRPRSTADGGHVAMNVFAVSRAAVASRRAGIGRLPRYRCPL